MIRQGERPGRALRACALSFLLTFTAVAAHGVAGGMLPSLRTICGSLLAVFGATWWVAARRRRGGTLVAAAVGSQLALHAIFAVSMRGSDQQGLLPSIAYGQQRGMPGHMPGMAGPLASWSAGGMLAAHCLAAAIALLSLRQVEDLLNYLLTFASAAWRLLIAVCAPRVQPARQEAHPTPVMASVIALLVASGLLLRGPPSPASPVLT